MKRIFLVVSLLSLVGAYAMANEEVTATEDGIELGLDMDAPTPAPKANPCAQINLTEAQKAQIKAGAQNFKAAQKTLFAKVKTDREAFEKLVLDRGAALPAAQQASQNVAADMGQVIAARQAFRTEILLQVLTAEQRAPALACQKMMAKMHRHHCHHHHHHHKGGHGNGNGQGGQKDS